MTKDELKSLGLALLGIEKQFGVELKESKFVAHHNGQTQLIYFNPEAWRSNPQCTMKILAFTAKNGVFDKGKHISLGKRT